MWCRQAVSDFVRLGNPAFFLGSQGHGQVMDKNSVLSWLRDAPPGTLVLAAELAARLDLETDTERVANGPEQTWREKLWTCAPETRLGKAELLEALGRSGDWLYRHTGAKARCSRIPCRKLDGELQFVAGEIRQWLLEHEEIVEPGRTGPLVLTRIAK